MESKLGFLFRSTTLHGFRHLADENAVTWKKGFTRIFWTFAFSVSFYFMFKMLNNVVIKASQSTAIMPDTSYLNWVNAFPAFSFCLAKGRNTEPIRNYIKENVAEEHRQNLALRHYRAMQSTLFLNSRDPLEGITLSHCLEINDTCGIDIELAKKKLLPKNCEEVIEKVKFLDVEIPCGEVFKLHQTELGACFIANSIYSHSNLDDFSSDFSALPLKYHNRANVDRTLEIHYKENDFLFYKFSIHPPEEMPDVQSPNTGLRKSGLINYVALKTTEFVNQPDVKFESQESRKCRFPSEKFSNFSLPYCKSNCLYLKRVEKELAACNCTLPTGLNVSEGLRKCTMRDVICIDELLKSLAHDLRDKEKAKKMVEDCLMPTCTSMEITKIGEFEMAMKDAVKGIGVIKIEVMNKPTLRYVRRVQFSKLDMIGEKNFIINLNYLILFSSNRWNCWALLWSFISKHSGDFLSSLSDDEIEEGKFN